MPTRSAPESQGRETRILLLIVVVSIGLLLLLARLRYPEADLPVIAPTQAPLIALSGPRGYEDLGERLSALLALVSSRVIGVDLESTPTSGRRSGDGQHARLGTAVKVRPDLAVISVPGGLRPRASAAGDVEIIGTDERRGFAALRVAPSLDAEITTSDDPFAGLAYVGVVEATRSGPTIQPAYIGRVSPLSDPRWTAPLLDVGAVPGLTPGAAVFSFDGHFLGLVANEQGTTVLVWAQAMEEILTALVPAGAAPQ